MTRRHPFHALCPYFAMFPESFVREQLLKHSSVGDMVFDPFCGRGTTVFESLLQGRRAAGSDINPVAACVAGAKADAPTLQELFVRIDELEDTYDASAEAIAPTPFFEACYAPTTLRQILFLRHSLAWRVNRVDRFIAAMMLGALHGESHRSGFYLSNRMPRTISTKPAYSIRWWAEKRLTPPERDTFAVLRNLAAFRYKSPPARLLGDVKEGEAREASQLFPEIAGQVKLIVTSPPYLDTTDYAEDQWLRLWFLGGAPQPMARQHKDDRITNISVYWRFLAETWAGQRDLLADSATLVIRIGGASLSKHDLLSGVSRSLEYGLPGFSVSALSAGITSNIRPRETTAFRPTTSRERVEHDFTFELVR